MVDVIVALLSSCPSEAQRFSVDSNMTCNTVLNCSSMIVAAISFVAGIGESSAATVRYAGGIDGG
jgi:hypothetical protein